MADRSEKAHERVRQKLQDSPGASTKELQEAAASADPSVRELSLRQFNAGYVLPVKRSDSAGSKKVGRGAPGSRRTGGKRASAPAAKAGTTRVPPSAGDQSDDRERVRATLLEFARDFSDADSRSEVVGVLSNLDRYVDKIVGSPG